MALPMEIRDRAHMRESQMMIMSPSKIDRRSSSVVVCCLSWLLCFPLLSLPAPAAAQSITWELINEYPATTLPGEADTFFAEIVKSKTGGRLVVQPIPDARSGLRS